MSSGRNYSKSRERARGTQLITIVPTFFGAMPNLGLYTTPDGSMPNPAELLPKGKIIEARESYDRF